MLIAYKRNVYEAVTVMSTMYIGYLMTYFPFAQLAATRNDVLNICDVMVITVSIRHRHGSRGKTIRVEELVRPSLAGASVQTLHPVREYTSNP